ncbi:Uncharacterized protein DAT39_012164, partial [Clarias magur]
HSVSKAYSSQCSCFLVAVRILALANRRDEFSVLLRASPRAVFRPSPADGAAVPASHTHRHCGRETR